MKFTKLLFVVCTHLLYLPRIALFSVQVQEKIAKLKCRKKCIFVSRKSQTQSNDKAYKIFKPERNFMNGRHSKITIKQGN